MRSWLSLQLHTAVGFCSCCGPPCKTGLVVEMFGRNRSCQTSSDMSRGQIQGPGQTNTVADKALGLAASKSGFVGVLVVSSLI